MRVRVRVFVCVCVCVRACVRACVRVYVHARLHVCAAFCLHIAYHLLSAADFGPWSSWGDCMCDLKRYRRRVCESEPCVDGDYVESEDCPCVPLDAAGMYRSRINITTSRKHLEFNYQHIGRTTVREICQNYH